MRFVFAFLATVAGLIFCASSASSLSLYPPGAVGHDISFPQCGATLPAAGSYDFGVVGVTGGFAFTHNPCLRAQYTWASASGRAPSVYINTKYPAGTTIGQRDTGPAGTCAPTNTRCQAYNYGYKTAQDAVAYAKTQGVVAPATWWLDVETENTWSENKTMNAVVLEAAIDYLESEQLTIGIYSTAHQWQQIAGEFAPGLPNWVAGASDLEDAKALCATGAFGGGTTEMVQYPGTTLSHDYVCTAEDIESPPPSSGSDLITGGTIPLEGGFGLAVFKGGTADQLVQATACPVDTAVFYFTVDGAFVLFIPGTEVTSVNAPFLEAFANGNLAANTAFLGKCE
jgi:hypothetical protein